MTAGPRRRGAPVPGRDRNPARAGAVCSAGVGLIRPARGVRVAVEPAFRLARCASLRGESRVGRRSGGHESAGICVTRSVAPRSRA